MFMPNGGECAVGDGQGAGSSLGLELRSNNGKDSKEMESVLKQSITRAAEGSGGGSYPPWLGGYLAIFYLCYNWKLLPFPPHFPFLKIGCHSNYFIVVRRMK